jgi:uncharacterized membrane protein YbhN (UPF0104 family)
MASTDTKTPPRRGLPLGWIIRLTGSATAIALTLWLLPADAIWNAIRSASVEVWLGVLALFGAGHIVAALKWRLLASDGDDLSIATTLRAHGAGLAANLSLPGVAGGDVVRAAVAMRAARNGAHVAVGSAADRIIDSCALVFLAGAGALMAAAGPETFSLLAQVAVFLIAGVAAGVALLLALRFAPQLPFAGLRRRLADVAAEYARRPGRLLACFALSVGVQAMFVALTIAFAAQAGVEAPVVAWFFAWPLAKLVATIPISIAGLGVREAALASFLAPFGAAPAPVVAAGLMWQSIQFAFGILCGIAFLATAGRSERRANQHAANPAERA